MEKTVAAPTSEKMEIEYAEAAPSALEIIPAVTTKASVASSGLDGQHGGHGSLASTGVSGRARERAGLSEMRQGRESRCGRGSKRRWGQVGERRERCPRRARMWVSGEDGTVKGAPRRSERESARANGSWR